MRFILLTEGQTEKQALGPFLKRWLDPRLHHPVGVKVVPFRGYAQLTRKLVRRAQMHLDGPGRDQVIAVIGLLDLYGPAFYPDDKRTADERYDWGVRHFEREVNRPSFLMFFAVHELEAWLLSQPSLLPDPVRAALPGRASQPEAINFDEPPAKLLDRLYKAKLGKPYKKVTYGAALFPRLDPDVAITKCPRLRSMLEQMLRLARATGL